MKRLGTAVGVAALAAAPALALDEPPAAVGTPGPALVEAIEVVARGVPSPLGTAVPRVHVIGSDDIERRQATNVLDLLSEVPGAYVLTDGPRGQTSRVFLRGAASNQTQVLVDGVPQNDATVGGLFDFNDLSTAAVERVDVLRGSYGVLYGSEAIGGVVAVTTRAPKGPWGGFVRTEGGSFRTHREVVSVGGGDDGFGLRVTGANEGSRGDHDREAWDAREVTARIAARVAQDVWAEFSLRSVESEVESPYDFPGFGATTLPEDENIVRTRDTTSLALSFTHAPRDWISTRLSLSRLRVDSTFRNRADGVAGGIDELDSRNEAVDTRVRLQTTLRVARAAGWRARRDGGVELDVTLGGEHQSESSESSATFPNFGAPGATTTEIDRTPRTTSGFVLAEARFADGTLARRGVLSAGVRSDRHSEFGGETSPFAGGRFDVAATDTTLRANWGRGFRAPKPAELDDPFAGNPDLGPETSTSFDVGASQPILDGRVVAGATWFRVDTDDLIAFDTSTFTLENIQETRTTGWEYEVAADAGSGFTVRGAFTRQNPRDRNTAAPLPSRSRDFFGGGVAWQRGAFRVSLDGLVTGRHPHEGGEFTAPDGEAREAPGRRSLVTLSARWRASDAVTVFGRIENLLDDAWVATSRAPAGTGIGVMLGLEARF